MNDVMPERKSRIDTKSRVFAVQLMRDLVVPTFVLDSHGDVLIWNTALERLTGVPASDVMGTKKHWTGFYPEERPCLADLVLNNNFNADGLYAEVLSSSRVERRISAENWCKFPIANAMRYLAIDSGPIFSDSGELLAVVETIRDITEQKKAQTALEELANQDGLTGVANRRAFDAAMADGWAVWRATGQPLGLLLVDIDHFKKFNDHYGHQAGDDCLKTIASVLRSAVVDANDTVARFGGEEFAIILSNADDDTVRLVGKRVLSAIDARAIPHEGAPHSTVSVSIGGASSPNAHSAHSLIGEADAALYRAKKAGRRQFELAALRAS